MEEDKINVEEISREAYYCTVKRIESGDLFITTDSTSDKDFWRQFKKLKKERQKFIKDFRKYYNYPSKALLEFEKIMYALELTNTLLPEDVHQNREKLFKDLGEPSDFLGWIHNKREELAEKTRD